MALHEIPDDGAPHAPTTECGCSPVRTTGERPDGTFGAFYVHHDQTDGRKRQEGPRDAAARQ